MLSRMRRGRPTLTSDPRSSLATSVRRMPTVGALAARMALLLSGAVLGLGLGELGTRQLEARPPAPAADVRAPLQTGYPSAGQYLAEAHRYFELMDRAEGDLVFHHRAHIDDVFQGVRVRTNADGWRDAEPSTNKAGRLRIVAAGDSVTFGWGAEERDTYPRRLERMLSDDRALGRDVEVVNLGNGGYNTAQERAALLRYGFAYDPDLVTLLYVNNDFHSSYGQDELADRIDPAGGVWSRLKDRVLPVWRLVVERSVLLTQIVYAWRPDDPTLEEKITRRFGSIDAYWEQHPGWIRSREALRGIAQDCRRRGVPLVVFTYSLSEDFFTRNLYPRVARVGAEEGFPVIDVRTRARLTEPVEGYVNSAADLHPNAKGHAVIADVMHEVLRDRAAATGVK